MGIRERRDHSFELARSAGDEFVGSMRDLTASTLRRVADFVGSTEQDPVEARLAEAAADDEPLTDDDRAAADQARAEFERGETSSLDEIKARHG